MKPRKFKSVFLPFTMRRARLMQHIIMVDVAHFIHKNCEEEMKKQSMRFLVKDFYETRN